MSRGITVWMHCRPLISMNAEKLRALEIQPEAKARSQSSVCLIFLGVALSVVVVCYFAWPKKDDERHVVSGKVKKTPTSAAAAPAPTSPAAAPAPAAATSGRVSGSVLTVSGYIV